MYITNQQRRIPEATMVASDGRGARLVVPGISPIEACPVSNRDPPEGSNTSSTPYVFNFCETDNCVSISGESGSFVVPDAGLVAEMFLSMDEVLERGLPTATALPFPSTLMYPPSRAGGAMEVTETRLGSCLEPKQDGTCNEYFNINKSIVPMYAEQSLVWDNCLTQA